MIVKDVLMRGHPWLTPVLALLLTAAGTSSATAQYPGGPGGYSPPPPPNYSSPVYNYQRLPFGANPSAPNGSYPTPISLQQPAPGGGPAEAPGRTTLPESGMSFPAISPFMSAFNQHVNEGGLWFNRQSNRGRKYFMSLEYLMTRSRKPKGLVGNEFAPSYLRQLEATTQTPIIDVILGLDDLDDGADEFMLFESQIPLNRTVAFVQPNGGGANYFNPIDASAVGTIQGDGIRFKYGAVEDDGGGAVLTAWWNTKSKGFFDARDGLARSRNTQSELFRNYLDEITFLGSETDGPIGRELAPEQDLTLLVQNNVHLLRGIPLDDGTLQTFDQGQAVIGGVTAPYDLEFRVNFETESGGGSLNWFSSPMTRFGPIEFRPIGGLRYQYIREDFNLFAMDSGLIYFPSTDPAPADIKVHSRQNQVDDDMDGIVDNAGIVEFNPLLGQGGGGGGGGTGTLTVDFSRLTVFPELFPITSFLDSKARSHLAGPEIGLQYGIDGKRFRLQGQTTIGLMANYERITLRGDNIGMVTRPADFNIPTTQNVNPNAFTDSENHTHVSPLIETSLTASAQLLSYVPILKRIEILSSANFQLGYTFLYVGAVAAPEDSILWKGNPALNIFPEIALERQDWTLSAWSFGLEWTY